MSTASRAPLALESRESAETGAPSHGTCRFFTMLALSSASLSFAGMVTAPSRSAPSMMAKSKALPFLEAPAHCDGTLAGDEGFDPLNFGGLYNMKYLREAEIKHGRVCMLATFGFVMVDLGLIAPGAPAVSSLAAHDVTVKSGHMLFLLFVVAIWESLSYNAIAEMMSGETDRAPGDYGIPYRFCREGDTATQEKYQLQEITHGRAAMLGFSGMVTASALGEGHGFPYF